MAAKYIYVVQPKKLQSDPRIQRNFKASRMPLMIINKWACTIYLAKPNAASFHWYFSSAAAPASGNMAFTLYTHKIFTLQFENYARTK